jgi:hypothetical protein
MAHFHLLYYACASIAMLNEYRDTGIAYFFSYEKSSIGQKPAGENII